MGGGAIVFLLVAIPLWREFYEPGQSGWNMFLGILITCILVGAFFLQKYFRENIDEIGEARFDTRNSDQDNG